MSSSSLEQTQAGSVPPARAAKEKPPTQYRSPAAFRQALEMRLRGASSNGADFIRRRQLLVFDRFLARVGQVLGEQATLKGGLVLEIRLERARTTRDVDLRLVGPTEQVLEQLQAAGRLELGDWMAFEVRVDNHHPDIQNEGMQYAGYRFRAECFIAGKGFGSAFGVDVAFGDPILGEPEEVTGDDVLGFAGVEPPRLRLYPVETHIAEKLHAYSLPRERINTRVKDLPDLALLATTRALEADALERAFQQTFTFRRTHALPELLPPPPQAWEAAYAQMAEEDGLAWKSLAELEGVVRAFIDPVLSGEAVGRRWEPASWRWAEAGAR